MQTLSIEESAMSGDPIAILNPGRIFSASDLLVWKYSLHGIRIGCEPASTCFSNPILHEGLVVASTFSPGRVCAIDKMTGEARWLRRLSYYGATPISAQGSLLSRTSKSLLALSPKTGKTRWEFTPNDDRREMIYSLPVVANESVFIGDRAGRFWCLSAATGKERWSVDTSAGRDSSVNATALVLENLVISATSSSGRCLVLACDQATGQEVWRKSLPDNSLYQVQWYEGMVLVRTTQVLYGLSPQTGEILHKWSWRGQEVSSLAVAGTLLCVVVTNEPGIRGAKMPARPRTELLGIHHDEVKWRLPYPRYSGADLRWDPESRCLYESMYLGLGIVNPETGQRDALLTGFAPEPYHDHVDLPCFENGRLYLLHARGTVWALQHPAHGSAPGNPSSVAEPPAVALPEVSIPGSAGTRESSRQ